MSQTNHTAPWTAAPLQPAKPPEHHRETPALGSDTPLPGHVFVVSDLHLAAGRAPVTGRVDPGENFFEDGSFERFLRGAWERWAAGAPDGGRGRTPAGEGGANPGGPPLLVLNGDTLDFTRLVRLPQDDADLAAWSQAAVRAGLPAHETTIEALRRRIGPRERRFGLGTSAVEAVWKVRTIIAGHPVFFRALGWWVERGGHVLVIRGNHDLELAWLAVQRALLAAIAGGGPALDVSTEVVTRVAERVSFEDHGRVLGNVWLEHGHRFEPTTAVPGEADRPAQGDAAPAHPPTDPRDPEQLQLPLGSLINIYLINPIERWRPLLDNIKPVESALWAVFRYAPVASLGVLFRGATWLPPALRRYHLKRRSAPALAVYLTCVAVLWIAALGASTTMVVAVSGLLPTLTDWVTPRLGWFLLGFLLLWPTVGLARDAWRRLHPAAHDAYPRAARDAALAALVGTDAATGARLYAVVGHTHAQDARLYPAPQEVPGGPGRLGATPREVVVLNTGTWIPIVDTSLPGAASTLPRMRRPFVHLTLTHESGRPTYTHEHLQWDDARGEPAPSLLLARE